MSNIFVEMGDILSGAKRRREREYAAFMAFFRETVETVPTDIAKAFGTMPVEAFKADGTPTKGWGIELSVSDYIFWKDHLAEGARFKFPVESIKRSMLHHLSKKIEASTTLEPKERKALLALLDRAEGE